MKKLVIEGRRQPLGNLTLIFALELRPVHIFWSEDVFQISPVRVKHGYWALPQNVAHYLARLCTWAMMNSSVHDVALRHHIGQTRRQSADDTPG
eukprot:5490280-Pyramimonas_sp.AAC.1